jgi:hypothetical protein
MMLVGDGDEDVCNDGHGDDGYKYSNDGHDDDIMKVMTVMMMMMRRIAEMVMVLSCVI